MTTPNQLADEILRQSARLLDMIKQADRITPDEAEHLVSTIREAEGWLRSCRDRAVAHN